MSPDKYMQSFFNGLTAWAYNVLPALFPFTVLSVLALKFTPKFKRSLSGALFKIECDQIWIMSLLCGYPIGAKAVGSSDATTEAATRACAFCSTAGPIFMIATVGSRLLKNTTSTAIIILSHFFASVLNGFLYRSKIKFTIKTEEAKFKASDFGNTVTDSVLSILSVGGLIALFYMLTEMLKSLMPPSASESIAIAFLIGMFEMTNGIFAICGLTDVATATILCSGLLALGGLCVFCQCFAFLGGKVKAGRLILMKCTQSSLATILSFIATKLLL